MKLTLSPKFVKVSVRVGISFRLIVYLQPPIHAEIFNCCFLNAGKEPSKLVLMSKPDCSSKLNL